MINGIKKVLFKLLGQDNYLRVLQKGFFILYDSGYLKKDVVYKYHYFVKHLVRRGDTVVDLGANLGYFSKIFARLVGPTGRVISIEPVVPFFRALKTNLHPYSQCQLYNYALGTEEKTINMAVPKSHGYLRTGLAHVSEENNSAETDFMFPVKMVRGSALLKGVDRIDYIKCDIEGYEEFVLPELAPVIRQHKPMIQVETWGPHKKVVMGFLVEEGYEVYMLTDGRLQRVAPEVEGLVGDYLLIHREKSQQVLATLPA